MKKFILGLLLLSSQAFAGAGPVCIWGPGPIAKCLAPIASPDGTLASPGMTFASETGSGWYRLGAGDIGMAVTGTLGIEVLKLGTTQFNFGLGQAAGVTAGSALSAGYTFNGVTTYGFANLSTGTASQTSFCIGSGASGGNCLNLENNAFNTTAFWGGGGGIRSSANLSFLNISSENATGYITFNTGGAIAAGTERVRIDQNGHVIYKGSQVAPTVTAGCGSSPTVVGSDVVGQLNVGTGGVATTCTITFNKTWTTVPKCFVQDETSQATTTTVAPTATTMVLTATVAWTASSKIDYFCVNYQ